MKFVGLSFGVAACPRRAEGQSKHWGTGNPLWILLSVSPTQSRCPSLLPTPHPLFAECNSPLDLAFWG